jgi:hypothetical protein
MASNDSPAVASHPHTTRDVAKSFGPRRCAVTDLLQIVTRPGRAIGLALGPMEKRTRPGESWIVK